MDVLAAVVSADSVALVSLWEAPTLETRKQRFRNWICVHPPVIEVTSF
jgi:hypothetical protein